MMRRRRMRRRKTMTTDGRLHRSLRNSSASMKTCNQIPAGPANATATGHVCHCLHHLGKRHIHSRRTPTWTDLRCKSTCHHHRHSKLHQQICRTTHYQQQPQTQYVSLVTMPNTSSWCCWSHCCCCWSQCCCSLLVAVLLAAQLVLALVVAAAGRTAAGARCWSHRWCSLLVALLLLAAGRTAAAARRWSYCCCCCSQRC